jgi:hypothetical protein
MKTNYLAVLIVAFLVCQTNVSTAQCDFYDDFEDTSLLNWTIISGSNELSYIHQYQGNTSLRMINSGSYAKIESTQSIFDTGSYTMWFYMHGEVVDAYFRFHYLNSDNYYQIALMPLETDNPTISFSKVINGTSSSIYSTNPDFDQQEWIKLGVNRHQNGVIDILINDTLTYTALDQDLTESGFIQILAYDTTVYLDQFCYSELIQSITEEPLVEWNIYPNPCQSILTVESRDLNLPLIIVYDLQGKQVLISEQKAQINISELEKGLYLICLKSRFGQAIGVRKIWKI